MASSDDDSIDITGTSTTYEENDLEISNDQLSSPTIDPSKKRGRGRPKKIILSSSPSSMHASREDMESSTSPLSVSSSDSTISAFSQGGPESSSTKPIPKQGSADDKRSKAVTGQCESCMANDVRIVKYGKLRVCKECEGLMRAATGSNRRQSTQSNSIPTMAEFDILQSTIPSEKLPSTFNFFTQDPGSSSSPKNKSTAASKRDNTTVMSKQGRKPSVSSTQDSTPKKRGRKPKSLTSSEEQLNDIGANPNDTVGSSLKSNGSLNQTTPSLKKRGRKPKNSSSSQDITVEISNNIPEPSISSSTDDHTPADSTIDLSSSTSSSSIKSSQNLSNNFQTTGAFFTRTASRLLGGQTVTDADFNIHGYAFQRPCKVLNIDGTWYFGTMISLENGKILVHFDGWGSEWDEWLASDSRRLKILQPEEIIERKEMLKNLKDDEHSGGSSSSPPNSFGRPILPMPTNAETDAARAVSFPKSGNKDDSTKKPKGEKSKQTPAKRRMTSDQDGSTTKESAPRDRIDGKQQSQTNKRQKKMSKAERLEMLFQESEDIPLPEPVQPLATPIASGPASSSASSFGKGTTFRSLTKPGAVQDRRLMTPADVRALLDKVYVGMKVQARDRAKQWYQSTVLQIKSHRLLIQYDGWSDIFNEWMDVGSERLIIPSWKPASPIDPNRSDSRKARSASVEAKQTVKESNPKAQSSKSSASTSRASQSTNSSSKNMVSQTQETTTELEQVAAAAAAAADISFDGFSSSSDDLSDPLSTPPPSDPEDKDDFSDSNKNEIQADDIAEVDSASPDNTKEEAEPTPAPIPPHALGNPIQLGLDPQEIAEFEYQDEEKEILKIIHRVLDTGLIKNRVIETPPEDLFPQPRASKKKKKSPLSSAQCNEGNGEGGSNREDGGSGDDEDENDETHTRTNTKTRDRFVALLEARQQTQGDQPSGPGSVSRPTVRKDTQQLQEARQLAMRNMCSAPLIRFVRQVIYDEADRTAAMSNSFENRRQKLVKALTARKNMKQRRFGPLSTRILGLSNASNILGVTFNEAGYIETTPASLKAPNTQNDYKITKKKKGRKPLKSMEDPNINQDENQPSGPITFQNLRSLTRKKRKKILKEDHITFLRRTMVPGKRIRARDRQMDWLTAVIRDVKNSRVLVHYENYHEYFNEWIDINSERLKFDPTLDQSVQEEKVVIEPPVKESSVPPQEKNEEKTIEEMGPNEGVLSEPQALEVADNIPAEGGTGQVSCVQCQVKISQFRIYCMYCEAESKIQGSEREPFNLCLWCFSNAFPDHHDHPKSSFATKVIVGPTGVRPVKGGIITRFEKDSLDYEYSESSRPDSAALRAAEFQAMMDLENDQSFTYLDQWKDRKVCAFCNDDGTIKDQFIGPYPFLISSTNRYGSTKKRHFWAHDACARHSPEVIQGKDGTWYNVSMAMRRGRTVKCNSCKEKGATIGCFDPKCGKSFHVPCTGKPMSNFEDGVIFWCPQHERELLQRGAYEETFSCDKCSNVLGVNPWQTCVKCSSDYFHTFDLCQRCFSAEEIFHEHGKEDFKVTSLEIMYQEQLEKEAAQAQEQDELAVPKKKTVSYKPKMRSLSRLVCSYCWSATSAKWRKGYNGVLMCEDCFSAGPLNETPMQPPMFIENMTDPLASEIIPQPDSSNRGVGKYATSAEDYSHSPYLTRTAVSAVKFDHSSSQAVYLDSYGPAENQLYSLPIDTTYYDIPGRAPRWATHSGTDYHGTWLPQTVRRGVTKFTRPNEKILSNFLGRGTDAIECFLLGRCCTAVDINPAAITLSIRNCSFAIPPDSVFKAEHRPTILQGDSRKLTGPLFENESFDHVLSHPPYKDCVAYSTHIDGDLSRFGNSAEFQHEMKSVIRETHRLLKMGRRCTLGIGDNREHCFYIPVSFQLIRQYINEGFELEELIVKRQRYCAMFGLGTYLCVQFDFLCFTHEFIATLRKIPLDKIDTMILEPDFSLLDQVDIRSIKRAIPSCPIERKSVVMGSVWTFKPTEEYDFPTLCASRMVERFGRNDANWEEYMIKFPEEEEESPPHLENTESQTWTEHIVEKLPPEEEEMVSYERDRLNQIQENNRMLLALGLITELSETSDDIGHQNKIAKDTPCYPPPAETALRMIAHVPNSVLKSHQVPAYRTAIMHLALEALEKLPISGVFVVGTQDFRRPEDAKLIPLSMLVLEDIIRVVGEDCLRLKELIEAVPDGYQKDRRKITCQAEFEEETCIPGDELITKHLPIVHACYLVFTKVKERNQPEAKEPSSESQRVPDKNGVEENIKNGIDISATVSNGPEI